MSNSDKIIYSAEFDMSIGATGKVLLKEVNSDIHLFVSGGNNNAEYSVIQTDRDQWGVWITFASINIAQEDQTRSFIDAMIKCLTEMRRLTEVETKDATVVALS